MAPTTRNPRTPGVYITELDAFPPSIVGVQTAVPAFIGYTQRAEISGEPAYGKAIKLGSLVDFEAVFGGGYKPLYHLAEATTADVDADKFDFSVTGYANAPPYDAANPPASPSAKFYALTQVDATKFALYDSMRLFFANGGGNCYVVSVGSYLLPGTTAPRPIAAADLLGGLEVVGQEVGPTLLVIPDATLLTQNADYQSVVTQMMKQAAELQDRVAIIDVWGTETIGDGTHTLDTVIANFRAGLVALSTQERSYGAAYFPFLETTVWSADEVDYTNIDVASQSALMLVLDYQNAALSWDFSAGEPTARYEAVAADIMKIPATMDETTAAGREAINALRQDLGAALPLLGDIGRAIISKNEVSPPSGAMAGIYTANDQDKGVWNAPANVSLRAVDGLTLRVDDAMQADLNVPVDGMAVAVIREFRSRGQVVWGARTLDGNSPDYRYIQVRRTLIYIEQSVKAGLETFVFAANDGKTWVAAKAMVSGFLQQLWNQGGLMGATAAEAFTVECGLGSTMTGQDILDGYMIVNVTLQMIRPAEFIELTFKQKLEGVA